MKLKNCIGIIGLILALLNVHALATTAIEPLIPEEDIGDDLHFQGIICSKNKHLPLSKFTCCNGTVLTNWINEKYWTSCQSIASTGDESIFDSIWRVYTCALSKSLGNDQKKISLAQFTNIMTANYPDKIKESISGSIKELSSKSTSEKPDWLTSDVSLTDTFNVNRIRTQYYDVEKQVCMDDEKVELDISSESPDACNGTEEMTHRFGACCINGSIPFRPYSNSPSKRLNSLTTCNKTMERFLSKFDKDDNTQYIILHICGYPCYLIENSFLTMDDVLKLRQESDVPPMEIILNSTYPYFPLKLHKDWKPRLTRMYNGTLVMEQAKNALIHFNLTHILPEDLYWCVALNSPHHWLANVVRESRFSIPGNYIHGILSKTVSNVFLGNVQ